MIDLKRYANLCRIAYDRDAIAQYQAMGWAARLLLTSTAEQVYWLHSPTRHEEAEDGGGEIPEENIIVLAGTNQPMDWLINLMAVPMGSLWDCHPGYAAIATALVPVIRQIKGPLIITGHSKGGAIAALLGAMVDCQVVTFGSPRIGSQRFADNYPSDRYLRIVDPQDIVARIPSRLAGYRHCGQAIVWHENQYYPSEQAWDTLKAEYPMWRLLLRLVGSIGHHFRYWD